MSVAIPDPVAEFYAQDPSILRPPDPFTPAETEQIEAVQNNHTFVKAAVGIGAAYLVYRAYMARKLKQEVVKHPTSVTRTMLGYLVSGYFTQFGSTWVKMTAPYLVKGYVEGMHAVDIGTVPRDVLQTIAEGYARQLGLHLNETSAEAMLSGYQAQVNRRVPPFMAAQRVAESYGVPQRTMNTLVSIWTSEDVKNVTDQVLPSAKAERAAALIAAANELRARQVGENEYWAARTQGKQMVWMYGLDAGIIPAHARRTWITAHDERVCPTCGPMNTVQSPINDKFTTPVGELWTPPAHPNCRCDVMLDLTDQVTEELEELIAAESVSKARGSDRYDRDRGGRFSRQESRLVRQQQDDENFRALMARIDRTIKPEVTEEKPVQPPKLVPTMLGGPQLGGSSLGPSGLLGPPTPQLTAPPLGAQGLAPTPLAPAKLGTPQLGTQIGVAPLAPPALEMKPNPQLQVAPAHITQKPVVTEDTTWTPMDHSLMMVLTEKEFEARTVDGEIVAYTRDNFYEVPDEDTDAVPVGLNQRIGQHWEEVYGAAVSEHAKQRLSTFKDERGNEWVVDDLAYEKALRVTIDRVDIKEGAKEENLVQVFRKGGDPMGSSGNANPVFIAQQLGLMENVIIPNMPILVETRHEFQGVTQQKEGERADVYQNPGRWVVAHADHNYGDANNHPYTRVEMMPESLGPI